MTIAITFTEDAYRALAQQLGQQLQLPVVESLNPDYHYFLLISPQGYALLENVGKHSSVFLLDYAKLLQQNRMKHPASSLLKRALGMKTQTPYSIVDATAGWGYDALVFAALNCKVILLERHPVIFTLVENAFSRCRQTHPALIQRIHYQKANAIDFLKQAPTVDVVYLDPMYPHKTKSALNKKPLRLLRALAGDDEDSALLLPLAQKVAKKRVVVKRPRLAPPLADIPPDCHYQGKIVRYDVYFTGD